MYCQKDWLDYLQFFIIFLTLIVLVKYTIETYRLRKLAAEQNELYLRPAITLVFSDESKKKIALKNIGYGPAFNIAMNKFTHPESKETLIFTMVDQLETKQQSEFYYSIYSEGKPTPDFNKFEMHLFPLDTFDFEIRFQNITGLMYQSKISIDLKEMRIIFKETKKAMIK